MKKSGFSYVLLCAFCVTGTAIPFDAVSYSLYGYDLDYILLNPPATSPLGDNSIIDGIVGATAADYDFEVLLDDGLGGTAIQYFNIVEKTTLPDGFTESTTYKTYATDIETVNIYAIDGLKLPINVSDIWLDGGIIYNKDTGNINSINGDFIGNTLRGTAASGGSYGAVIRNFGIIENLTGSFFGNTVESLKSASGGVINTGGHLSNRTVSIDTINGYFVNNGARGTHTNAIAYGGAIAMGTETTSFGDNESSVNKITGIFLNNYATADNGSSRGGAIYNAAPNDPVAGKTYDAIVGEIDASFIGNNSVSVSNYAAGGAIYNNGQVEILTGEFVGNYAQSQSGSAQGGAIFNTVVNSANPLNGIVQDITGSFYNNYAISDTGTAQGGAIYNTATVHIHADTENVIFQNNYVQNGATKNYNAIYNTGTVYLTADDGYSIMTYDSFEGNGTYNLVRGILSLQGDNAKFSSDSKLVAENSSIYTNDNAVRNASFGNLTLNTNIGYGLDVDLSNGTADEIDGTSINLNGNKFVIEEINIVNGGNNNVFIHNYNEDIILGAVKLTLGLASQNTYNLLGYTPQSAEDINAGKLNFATVSLKEAVNMTGAASGINTRAYTMFQNEDIMDTLGDLGGVSLGLYGNNFELTASNNADGINVALGQQLTIRDIKDVSGFANSFVNNLGTLEIEATDYDNMISSAIINNGTMNLITEEDVNITLGEVSGNGDITFSGLANVIFDGNVSVDQLDLSAGNLTFNSELNANTLNVTKGTNSFNSNITAANTNINMEAGSIFDISNNVSQDIDFGNLTLSTDLNVDIDIDLINDTTDNFNATSVSGGGKIIIDKINVFSALHDSMPKLDFQIANDVLKDSIDISSTTISSVTGISEIENYLLGYNNATGTLSFSYSDLSYALSSDVNTKAYTITTDETITNDLLPMNGGTLTINGGGNNITGDNITGTSIATDQILNISNVANISGFVNGFIVDNLGTINIESSSTDTNISGATTNNGELNLSVGDTYTITMGDISGNGNITTTGLGQIDIVSINGENINIGANINSFSGAILATGDINITNGTTNFADTVNANGLNISSDVVFNGDVIADYIDFNNANKTVVYNGNVSADTFTSNAGTVELDATLTSDNIILNNSTFTLGANGIIASNSNLSIGLTNLNFNNGVIGNIELQSINISDDVFYSLDVSLAGTPSADRINVSNVTGDGIIYIKEINVLNDPSIMPISGLNIASAELADKIDITQSYITAPSITSENWANYLISYDGLGNLDVDYSSLDAAISSVVAQKSFNMSQSSGITMDSNLSGDSLTINANNNEISGTNIITITDAAQNLTVNDALVFSPSVVNNGTLEFNDATTITGSITNNATLNLKTNSGLATNINAISGSGDINISGADSFAFQQSVTADEINFNAGAVTFQDSLNATTFNSNGAYAIFSGDTNITNLNILSNSSVSLANNFTGNINIDDATVNINNATILPSSTLIVSANGGTLNSNGGTIKSNAIDKITFNGDLNLNIDVSLENTPSADVLTAANVSGTGNILLKEINVLTNADSMPINNVMISNDILGAKIDISDATLVNKTSTSENYSGYLITYDNAGGLSFAYSGLESAITSIVAQKTYNMQLSGSETLSTDLTFGGGEMHLNANGSNITGGGSITIANSNQILNINNISGIDSDIENSGTLNLTNTTNNAIYSGNINSNGNIVLDSGINTSDFSGTINQTGGTFDITGNTNFNNNVFANNMVINSGIINFARNISGNITVNSGITKFGSEFSNGRLTLGAGTIDFETGAIIGNDANLTTLGGGSLDLTGNSIDSYTFESVDLSGNTNMAIDVDLGAGTADKIIANSISGDGKITINQLNISSDASAIGTDGANVSVSGGKLISGDYIDLANGINLTINNIGTSAEDYENGYFISYSDLTGNINFKFADLKYAFESNVADKAYAFTSNQTIDNTFVLNGDSLTLDGNNSAINGSGEIDLNGNELSVRETQLNSIDMNVNNGILNLYVDTILNNEISGNGTINIFDATLNNANLSGFTGNTTLNGNLDITSSFDSADFFAGNFTVNGNSNLNIQNDIQNIFDTTNWTLNSDLNTKIDADLLNGWADGFTNTNLISGSGKINITEIKILNDNLGETIISLTNNTGGTDKITIDENVNIYDGIYQYRLNSDLLDVDGTLKFTEGALAPVSFTPSAYAAAVVGQTNLISNLTLQQKIFGNFGSIVNHTGAEYYGAKSEQENSGLWFEPYVYNDTVNLTNDVSVESRRYGMLIGYNVQRHYYDNANTPTYKQYGDGANAYYGGKSFAQKRFNTSVNELDLNKFWRANYGIWGGYSNSSDNYKTVSISKHSFNFGGSALFNRGNWFIGALANVGADLTNLETNFGSDDFIAISAGGSVKGGYNFALANDNITLQPNVTMSYVYVNTPEYTDAANIDISKYDASAIVLSPGVRGSIKLSNNWYMFAGVAYNEMITNAKQLTANSIELPDIAADSYTEFNVGFQKQVISGLDSYIQGSYRTGGVDGFGISIGIKKPI